MFIELSIVPKNSIGIDRIQLLRKGVFPFPKLKGAVPSFQNFTYVFANALAFENFIDGGIFLASIFQTTRYVLELFAISVEIFNAILIGGNNQFTICCNDNVWIMGSNNNLAQFLFLF